MVCPGKNVFCMSFWPSGRRGPILVPGCHMAERASLNLAAVILIGALRPRARADLSPSWCALESTLAQTLPMTQKGVVSELGV